MIIYLLTGQSGEYSDRSDWNIRAFVEKDGAQALKARLEEIETRKRALRSDGEYSGCAALEEERKTIDPKGNDYWDWTDYYIEEIELEGVAK